MTNKREERSNRAVGRSGRGEGFADRGVQGLYTGGGRAAYLTTLIDGGTERLEWSRLVFEIEGEADCTLVFILSDNPEPLRLPDELPVEQAAEAMLARGGVRRTGVQALLFGKAADGGVLCGRYCRAAAVFRFAGAGRLLGWRASFPKQSFAEYLPGIYWENEALERYLAVFETFYLGREEEIDRLGERLDPAGCTEDELRPLADWLCVPWRPRDWGFAAQRRLVTAAARLYRWKGTARYYRTLVCLLTGVMPVLRPAPEGDSAGERCYAVVLEQPVTVGRDCLEELLARTAPLGVRFRLVLAPEPAGMARLDASAMDDKNRME